MACKASATYILPCIGTTLLADTTTDFDTFGHFVMVGYQKKIAMSLWFVVLLCFLPLVLFMPFTASFRQKFPDSFGYILSLLGTFVGIVAGLYFTDLAASQDTMNRTVKVLEASKEEMEWLINRAETIDKATDTLSVAQRKKYYFLEMPAFFKETLRSELLSESLHPKSHEQFNVIRENLLFDVAMLRQDMTVSNLHQMDEDLKDYKQQLFAAIEVMEDEINRLNKVITNNEFEKLAKQRIDSLMK